MKKNFKGKLSLLLAALLTMSLLGGCGATETSETTEPVVEAETSSEPSSDATKDSVVVAYHAQTISLAPDIGSILGQPHSSQIFESLWYAFDADNLSYRIAEEREWIDDTHCRIKLRDDVYDTEGNQITASDVVFSFKTCNAGGGTAASRNIAVDLEGFEIVDDFNIILTLKYPSGTRDQDISWMPIFSEKAYNDSEDQMITTPVGTGAYKLTEFVDGSHCILEYNEDYYRLEEAPQIKQVKVMFITDQSQRANVMMSGEADFSYFLNFMDQAAVDASGNVKTEAKNAVNQLCLSFNCGEESIMYKNVALRQAICYAIDAQAMSAINYNGLAQVSKGLCVPSAYGVTDACYEVGADTDYYAYNVEMAKAKLEEANIPEGTVIKLNYGDASGHGTIAEIVQGACKAIGLEVEITHNTGGTWLPVVYNQPAEWDMTVISWETDPAVSLWQVFGGNGIWHFDEEEGAVFTDLLEKAMGDSSGDFEYIVELEKLFYENCYAYGMLDDMMLEASDKNLETVWRFPQYPEYTEWKFN